MKTLPYLSSVVAASLVAGCAAPRQQLSPPRHPVAVLADEALSRYAMYGMSGTVLLAISGATVLEKGYGLADRERLIPAIATTKYDVGSITKTFTAAAVLRLVDDGRIALTDSLATLFPDVPAEKRGLTVHHLLTHTGGFALDPAHAGIAAGDGRDAYIAKAMSSALQSAPGKYSYSNLGYGLLAILVERLSGTDFRTFVDTELIAKAALTQTTWWRDSVALAIPGTAVGYVFSDRENVLSPEPPFGRGGPKSSVWSKWPLGAAGIVSTVGDLGRWLEALRGGRVLSPRSTSSMFSRQDTTGNQGYGWTVTSRGALRPVIYRGGSRTGFNSMLALYPEQGAKLVFALNQSVESQWQSLVWRTLEQAIAGQRDSLPPATVRLPTDALARFAGVYAVPGGGLIRVILEGDELLVGAEGQNAIDIVQGPAVPNAARYGDLSLRLLQGTVGASSVDTSILSVSRQKELAEWLSTRMPLSPSPRLELLGAIPHPSGGGRVQTFVRGGDADRPVVRLIWEGERVLAWSDGVRLPLFRRFRPTSPSTAVAFHAREPRWVTLRLGADASTVSLEFPDGRLTPPAFKTAPK